MMVGDDHIDSCFCGHDQGVGAAGATIRRDYQLNLAGKSVVFDVVRFEAVSFINPMRNINGYIGAGSAQKFNQHGCGANSIDVVIAKDQNFFLFQYGLAGPVDGRIHVFEGKRRAHLIEGCFQKFGSFFEG